MLNEHFVSVELNATDCGGIPERVEALWPLRETWAEFPYARVSFSGEWVLGSDGELLLGVSICRHGPARAKLPGPASRMDLAEAFHDMLSSALERHARLQTPGEAAREQVRAEVLADMRAIKPCWLDVDVMTEHVLEVLWALKDREAGRGFQAKYAVVLNWPEPMVRSKAIQLFGRFAERTGSVEFRAGGRAALLRAEVEKLLSDEDPQVRRAAAVALHQFEGRPVVAAHDEALVESALALLDVL